MTAEETIRLLALQPHPEGGYFRETYRSTASIPASALATDYAGARSVSTAIYFLLTGKNFSALHRLRSDEIWHFHAGHPIEAHLLYPDGRYEQIIVGNDLAAGHQPQALFPAGCWFGARIPDEHGFGLISCTVAPGFDFADFELARRADLIDRFPMHTGLITSLTRS